jgi:hypothetical protein
MAKAIAVTKLGVVGGTVYNVGNYVLEATIADAVVAAGLATVTQADVPDDIDLSTPEALLNAMGDTPSLVIVSASVTTKPSSPNEKDVYIVPSGSAWAALDEAYDNQLALFERGGWKYITPKFGWQVRNKADNGVLWYDGDSWETSGGGGSGTVTSVGLSLPNIFTISGSPVTTSGTLAATLANQSANHIFAGPASGGSSTPGFRALVAADIPDISSVYATKAYADGLVVGLLDDRGNFDASSDTFPSSGGSGTAGAILKGDLWTISVAGTLGGHAVTAGDVIRALVDTPGQTDANWAISENNLGYTPLNASLNDGQIYIGNGSNIGTARTFTGDVTVSNLGVTAIGATKVTSAMLNADVYLTAHSWGGQQTFTAPILGTPASGNLSNCTALPVGSITGFGTGVATALAVNVGSAGAFVAFNGALGTPSSGTISTGVTLGGVTMTLGSDADGDIYYRASNVLTRLPKGTALQGLRMNAGATAPEWAAIVASVTVGGGITSGAASRVLYENSSNQLGEAAGFTFDGTSVLALGVAGASVGAVAFKNATSGTITIQPVTGALGTVTLSLPAATDTLVGKATTDTLTNKTVTALNAASTVSFGTGSGTGVFTGIIASSATTITTSGTTEETVATITIPANSMSANAKGIRVTAFFSTAATGNNKTIKIQYGATVLQSVTKNTASGSVKLEAIVMRDGATSQKGFSRQFWTLAGTWVDDLQNFTTPGETLSGSVDLTIKLTTATAAAGASLLSYVVEFIN